MESKAHQVTTPASVQERLLLASQTLARLALSQLREPEDWAEPQCQRLLMALALEVQFLETVLAQAKRVSGIEFLEVTLEAPPGESVLESDQLAQLHQFPRK